MDEINDSEQRTCYLDRALTVRNKRRIAESMAAFTRTVLRGDPQEPATWRGALRRLGCDVAPFCVPGGAVADFAPISITPGRFGIVTYNVALSRRQQVRGLAHEFGHALLYWWVPHLVFDVDVVCGYHDDPRDVRHQIARSFERLMVG